MKYNVLSIGEATVDCFTFLSDDSARILTDHGQKQLAVNYADKILADQVAFAVGGNGVNTAVSFARLGITSYLYTVVGDDWVGDKIRRNLERERVEDDYIMVEKGPSSYTTALSFKAERTLFIHHVPFNYHLPVIKPVDWIYLTNLGQNFREPYQKTLEFARDHDIKISFNPGNWQLKAGLDALRPVFKQSAVLFVNREEAQLLTELPASATMQHLSQALYDLGPKIVVITDGAKGAYAFDGQELLFCDIFPIEVVERTGAGDAYGAGFTAALVHKQPIATAMRWGMANSASVVNQIGPEAGLLTDEQMVKMLVKNRHIEPKPVKD